MRVPNDVVELVKKCLDDRLKTQQIMTKLRERNMTQLKLSQLYGLKQRLKITKDQPKDLSGLVTWCKNRTSIPEDPDKVFCLNLHYSLTKADHLKEFRAIFSTPRLLNYIEYSCKYFEPCWAIALNLLKLLRGDYTLLEIDGTCGGLLEMLGIA